MANRRRNNRPNGGGGGGNRPQHNKATVFDSNGPDVRIRGTAFQIVEKYMTLAKDASASGDRVLAENYLQHAEHYQRVINSWAEESASRPYYGGNRNETAAGYGTSGDMGDNSAPDTMADAPTEEVVITRRDRAPRVRETDDDDLGLPASILGPTGGNAAGPKGHEPSSEDRAGPSRPRRVAITAG